MKNTDSAIRAAWQAYQVEYPDRTAYIKAEFTNRAITDGWPTARVWLIRAIVDCLGESFDDVREAILD